MPDLQIISSSADQTRAVAAALARQLRAGDVVVLSGDLGAGKTTFVQGAAGALGVQSHVTSPSFVLVREYHGRARLVHVDVYRLSSLQELIDLGYEEVFAPDAITFIEWGDAVSGLLPEERFEVDIRGAADDVRRIAIAAAGLEARARLEAMPLERWAAGV